MCVSRHILRIPPMNRRTYFPLALAAMAAASIGAWCAETVLFEGKSAFNQIWVTSDESGMRTLYFEKGGARQSVVKPGDPDHLELPYVRAVLCSLVFCESPNRILVVGLGGGTIPMFLHKHFPKAGVDVVDIDPVVVQVAKRFFGFREDARVKVHVADGRRFIEQSRTPYDWIILDAYGADNIPAHLTTAEFLQSVRRTLSHRGVVAANLWARHLNPQYDSMLRTYQEVFPEVAVIRVPGAGNRIVLALPYRDHFTLQELAKRAERITKQHGIRYDLAEYLRIGFEGVNQRDPGATVLRDSAMPPVQNR